MHIWKEERDFHPCTFSQLIGSGQALALRGWAGCWSVKGSLGVVTGSASSARAVRLEIFSVIRYLKSIWISGLEEQRPGVQSHVGFPSASWRFAWIFRDCWVLDSKSKATIYLWHLATLRIMEGKKKVIFPSFIHFTL